MGHSVAITIQCLSLIYLPGPPLYQVTTERDFYS